MQKRIGGRWGLLFGVVGVWAGAQEPGVPSPVSPEYRPTLAVLEVVAVDQESIERAQQLEAALLTLLATSARFEPVISPEEVRQQEPGLEAHCTTRACLEAARHRLQVQRVARLTVAKYESGSRVTLLGLDPSMSGLVRAELNIEDHVDRFQNLFRHTPEELNRDFLAKVLPQLQVGVRALATPNAKLVVENADPGLTVFLDGQPAGSGRLEVIRPRGRLTVSVGGSFYEPYDRVVTLTPGKTTTVELRLLAKPVTPLAVSRAPYSGLMSRPGVYLAMSGVTLLGVGLGLGISALMTEERLARPGSPVPVTRLEALNAPVDATAAKILAASGAALTAGGITWVVLTPTKPASRVDEPAVPAAGWTFSFGGTL